MEVLQPSNLSYFTEKKEPQALENFSKILKKKRKNPIVLLKRKKIDVVLMDVERI